MKNTHKWLLGLGLAIIPLSLLATSNQAKASQVVSQWFFGNWNCNIDGRSAQMQWYVVNDPQTTCDGDVCSSTSGVRIVGRFSDNGGPWVRLAMQGANSSQLRIRYLGNEQDNWYLKYNSSTRTANGWTTWRSSRYPLQCQKR